MSRQVNMNDYPTAEQWGDTVTFWLETMRKCHEMGLMAQGQLVAIGAISEDEKLFFTRTERRCLTTIHK